MALHHPSNFTITSLPPHHFQKLTKYTHKCLKFTIKSQKQEEPTKTSNIIDPLSLSKNEKEQKTTQFSTKTGKKDEVSNFEELPRKDEKVSDIGSEIKKAMEERNAKSEKVGFWNGVLEEVKEIEWPVFGKVVGTTGVVLSVMAGSSVVLLTVNAVLAELSDRIFAGRGVQDFFG